MKDTFLGRIGMGNYDVISLDMFLTLVDLQSNYKMWKRIIGEAVKTEKAMQYQSMLLGFYYEVAKQERSEGKFILTKQIYERCFEKLFRTYQIDFSATEATNILIQEHQNAICYEETKPFLDVVCSRYQVCIVSDTDIAMLPKFYEEYNISLFASEVYRSYKNDNSNQMFKEVISHYKVAPNRIIHIGDTTSDVLGAKREGITTCWVNRNNELWTEEVEPDYTISNLNELKVILNLNM
jgi:putative hydrolase of the HAD superfamily